MACRLRSCLFIFQTALAVYETRENGRGHVWPVLIEGALPSWTCFLLFYEVVKNGREGVGGSCYFSLLKAVPVFKGDILIGVLLRSAGMDRRIGHATPW